jgi:metal-sulfur cluster biosynthetic enzyme
VFSRGGAHKKVARQKVMSQGLINPNPVVYDIAVKALPHAAASLKDLESEAYDEYCREEIDEEEVFEIIRHINDPEHPLTLEQLNVAQLNLIQVDNSNNHILVRFTPTIPHCSMATLIGLCIRVKLLRSLPGRYKVDIQITPGTHSSEVAGKSNSVLYVHV